MGNYGVYEYFCSGSVQLKCTACSIQQGFWSVGVNIKQKFKLATNKFEEETNYGSILGGRLIGEIISKLEQYHETLSIPISQWPVYRLQGELSMVINHVILVIFRIYTL